jgi:hypothetical protein
MEVKFSISERDVLRIREEGNWSYDCPTGWASISTGERVKAGRGFSRRVTMHRDDADDLANYLWDAAGASASAAADDGGERGGWQRQLLRRIEAALLDQPSVTTKVQQALGLTEKQARLYDVLRNQGVGHSIALAKAKQDNFNPYREV